MLSPLAMPFMPTRAGYAEDASFAAIYNDGVPAGVLYGEHADHEIIHNIPDHTIEEVFPPDAAGKYPLVIIIRQTMLGASKVVFEKAENKESLTNQDF